ncbi:MAG: cytidylate kinase-like family protein [Lachnospiraceae bacterium]|nr:cytidylate kinase-like family protein [Lachnospiraceae bacterium]
MNQIITVGRQFGSGGRELARRLAEALGWEYYDREVIEQISEHTSFSEEYIRQVVEGQQHQLYPITINHTMNFTTDQHARIIQSVYKAQCDLLRDLADKSNCVIVGRCADYILRDRNPYRIFVYADMDSRVRRCMERQSSEENLTEKTMRKQILKIDKLRARYYLNHTGKTWGDKVNYDICINTTGRNIKSMIPNLKGLV